MFTLNINTKNCFSPPRGQAQEHLNTPCELLLIFVPKNKIHLWCWWSCICWWS